MRGTGHLHGVGWILTMGTIALIQVSPPAILWTGIGPANVNVPGKFQVSGVDAGWVSPDGAYKLVAVPAFLPAAGQQISGPATYAIDAIGNVTQTYSTSPIPPPTAQQTLSTGLQIVSQSTPTVSGTYAMDNLSQAEITAVAVYIQQNGKFPAGQTSLPWPEIAGNPQVFPSTALFLAFATAAADYVTAVNLGKSPSQPVTII
jgi:hypothetical protein